MINKISLKSIKEKLFPVKTDNSIKVKKSTKPSENESVKINLTDSVDIGKQNDKADAFAMTKNKLKNFVVDYYVQPRITTISKSVDGISYYGIPFAKNLIKNETIELEGKKIKVTGVTTEENIADFKRCYEKLPEAEKEKFLKQVKEIEFRNDPAFPVLEKSLLRVKFEDSNELPPLAKSLRDNLGVKFRDVNEPPPLADLLKDGKLTICGRPLPSSSIEIEIEDKETKTKFTKILEIEGGTKEEVNKIKKSLEEIPEPIKRTALQGLDKIKIEDELGGAKVCGVDTTARGIAYSRGITLYRKSPFGSAFTDDEALKGVLFHELGHVKDSEYKYKNSLDHCLSERADSPFSKGDDTASGLIKNIPNKEYVSIYAVRNQMEDFAEVHRFLLYNWDTLVNKGGISNLEKFNPVLANKYKFILRNVYNYSI